MAAMNATSQSLEESAQEFWEHAISNSKWSCSVKLEVSAVLSLPLTSNYLTDNADGTPTRPSLDHSVQGIKLLINGGSCKESCKKAGWLLLQVI